MRRGQKKHQWWPSRFRQDGVSTCHGCGAKIQRVLVAAVTCAAGVSQQKHHHVYVYRYHEDGAEANDWRMLWEVPSCPR